MIYTVGEVAKQLDVAASTLRYCDKANGRNARDAGYVKLQMLVL